MDKGFYIYELADLEAGTGMSVAGWLARHSLLNSAATGISLYPVYPRVSVSWSRFLDIDVQADSGSRRRWDARQRVFWTLKRCAGA